MQNFVILSEAKGLNYCLNSDFIDEFEFLAGSNSCRQAKHGAIKNVRATQPGNLALIQPSSSSVPGR